MLELFYQQTQAAISAVATAHSRELLSQIDWGARLVAIRGARGVGKTTLMLQHLKQNYGRSSQALYATLDDLFFSANNLIDLAREFHAKGGEVLYLDEVHKYPRDNWAQEIKNIYDLLPGLKVVFSGSSILKILQEQADLSRRALIYDLQGLSLREYISLKTGTPLPVFSLEDLLHVHPQLAAQILYDHHIRPLQYFSDYLREGYYPFFLENPGVYLMRVRELIKLIIEIDLNHLPDYTITDHVKISKLLYAIATSAPFKPNISKLSERVELNRNRLTQYIYVLEQARMLNLLHSRHKGVSALQKPDKIYLENPNLAFALSPGNTDVGSLRETFFLNQVRAPLSGHGLPWQVNHPEQGDFLIDTYAGQYTFEVGGKNKGRAQIAGLDHAYVAADELEIGNGQQIPLWLFGFLY
jgi:uncharacterized protein